MMVLLVTILLTTCFPQLFWHFGLSLTITLERCPRPDYPEFGGYGPKKSFYLPGDVILYFCDPGYYIGGNYRRVCLDSGDWSGDTPVCDGAAIITEYGQSSTARPEKRNDASKAIDGNRETCSKTLGEENGAEWNGILLNITREVLRFMLFLPKGEVSYEVFTIKPDGSEVSCGRNSKTIVMHDWVFHNCLQPNHIGVIAVKVKSLTNRPLVICEVVVHSLTDPTCTDPHFNVANGRLRLTRKTATLVCPKGFDRYNSPWRLDCIRTGVWSRRSLYCEKTKHEIIRPDQKPPVQQTQTETAETEEQIGKTEAEPKETGTEKAEIDTNKTDTEKKETGVAKTETETKNTEYTDREEKDRDREDLSRQKEITM